MSACVATALGPAAPVGPVGPVGPVAPAPPPGPDGPDEPDGPDAPRLPKNVTSTITGMPFVNVPPDATPVIGNVSHVPLSVSVPVMVHSKKLVGVDGE